MVKNEEFLREMEGRMENVDMTNIVLIVDMLRGFRDIGNLANPRMERIIPNIENLVKRKIKEGWKIIFLADNHSVDDEEFKLFPVHCVRGTEETEIIQELQKFVAAGIIVPKTRYSGFQGTNLDKIIDREKPKIVILVGVCTDICVFFTSYDLVVLGYKVIVPRDSVETYNIPVHKADEINRIFLEHMKNILGVKIVEKQEEV